MGPGRGSAAGSIVSYVLNITKVDPIKNGFIFERFLNPGRLSFPDIDSDVPRSQRAKAISYLQQRYGFDNVSQIITFGKYKLKNVTKDVMSNLGCPFQEANAITKVLYENEKLHSYKTLYQSLKKQNDELKEDILFCLKSIKQEMEMSTDSRTRGEMKSCYEILERWNNE